MSARPRDSGHALVTAGAYALPLPAGLLVYAAGWAGGFLVSTGYWFLPAGWRFAALMVTPRRHWLLLALTELATIAAVERAFGAGYSTWNGALIGIVLPWCLAAIAVAVLRPAWRQPAPDAPRQMAALLSAMLAAAVTVAIALTAMTVAEGQATPGAALGTAFGFAIGDFTAMLIVVPLAIDVVAAGAQPLSARRVLFAWLALLVVPLIVLLPAVARWQPAAAHHVALLCVVPIAAMAFRHGWRGAAWSMSACSLSMYALPPLDSDAVTREVLQMQLAITGAVALMLGSAIDQLRALHRELGTRNAALAEANQRLLAQTHALQQIGQRLVRAQEDEQRRIADDVGGDLGERVAALGSRMALLVRQASEPALLSMIDSLRVQALAINEAMHDLAEWLQPTLLERAGLETALRDGGLPHAFERAGVRYDVAVSGPLERLSDDGRRAVFRIAQQTAALCARHAACACRLELDCRLPPDEPGLLVALLLSIEWKDGQGMRAESAVRADLHMQSIRDRAAALDGAVMYTFDRDRLASEIVFVDDGRAIVSG